MRGDIPWARVALEISAAEFLAKSKSLARMPETVRHAVLARGFRAVGRASESRIVKDVASGTQMRQKDVRATIQTGVWPEGVQHTCISPWVPLAKLGSARQTKTGVTVRGWGSHRSAFIVAKFGGNVYARSGSERFPIKKLHGPNPANHINTHRARYEAILTEVAGRILLPEVERQLDLALAQI